MEIEQKLMMEKSSKPPGRQQKPKDIKSVLEAEYTKSPKWPYEKKVELAIQL